MNWAFKKNKDMASIFMNYFFWLLVQNKQLKLLKLHFLDNQNGRNVLGVFGHVKIEDGVWSWFGSCWGFEKCQWISVKIPFIHPSVTNLPYLDLNWIQVKLKYSLPKINTCVGKCVPQRWHANQPSSIIRFWKNVLCTNCTSW